MDRHYLAQTTGTGVVFSFFLLFMVWAQLPNQLWEFGRIVTGREPCGNTNLILAFGAVQPVIGIIIDSLVLPFAIPFHYYDDGRRLFQVECRRRRNSYKELLTKLSRDIQPLWTPTTCDDKFYSGVADRLKIDPHPLPMSIRERTVGWFKRLFEPFKLIPRGTRPIDPDIDFVVHHYQDKRANELKEWGRRQMAHRYWAENWLAGAWLGVIVGCLISYRIGSVCLPNQAAEVLFGIILTGVWTVLMLALRATMKKRENDMVMLWTLERLFKENEQQKLVGESGLLKTVQDVSKVVEG